MYICKTLDLTLYNSSVYTNLFDNVILKTTYLYVTSLNTFNSSVHSLSSPETHEFTSTQTCNKVVDFGFVKTHKAGSTTLISILQRFGYKHKLLLALPKQGL